MMKATIRKVCPQCRKVRYVDYKRRNRPGFCSLECAYTYRTLPRQEKRCKQCDKVFHTISNQKYCSLNCSAAGYRGYKHSVTTRKKMKAAWTEDRKKLQKPLKIEKSCRGCGKKFETFDNKKSGKRKFCSNSCRIEWLSNHMKRSEMRAILSKSAKSRSKEINTRIGESVKKAWEDGKYQGARTGKCYWYRFVSSDGKEHKVQGTWELAFAKWMDDNGLIFTSHRGRFPYLDSKGAKRNWYPDFYVHAWGAWVDVKADYFYNADKFNRIRTSNKGIRVKVLRLASLTKLGVRIYGPGHIHLPYLQDLIQRNRI